MGQQQSSCILDFKEIDASIVYTMLAEDIWDDLQSRFQQSNGPCVFHFRRDLANLLQGTNSINVYFTQLKAIWVELAKFLPATQCSCGDLRTFKQYNQSEDTMTYFMGLSDSFQSIRGQILLMDHLSY